MVARLLHSHNQSRKASPPVGMAVRGTPLLRYVSFGRPPYSHNLSLDISIGACLQTSVPDDHCVRSTPMYFLQRLFPVIARDTASGVLTLFFLLGTSTLPLEIGAEIHRPDGHGRR